MIAPGVVRNASGSRQGVVLGQPDGGHDGMLNAFAPLLASAGCAVRVSPAIQAEIWTKSLLAASAGSAAALTGADLDALTDDPDIFALLADLMREGVAIGRALGLATGEDVETTLAFYRGEPVRPSMLQDVEAGRVPEIENGILAFARMAKALGVDAPRTQVLGTLMHMKKKAMARPNLSGQRLPDQ